MIKVLHFVSTPAIWSGVMSVIMNYYRHMDRSKIQFDFLCFLPCRSEESYEDEIRKLGGRVYFIPKPGANVDALKQSLYFFRIHGGQYTWLHNHEIYLSFFLVPLAHYFGINNVIVHCHATQYSDKKLTAMRNRILCIPLKFMKYERFSCSRAAGAFLFGEHAVRNGHVHILYNAIDETKFQYNASKRREIRDLLKIPDSTCVIGHVGRFVPQKNHMFLLQVFRAVCSRNQDAVLLLIGDGPLFEYVISQGKEMKIHEKVIYAGYRKNAADYFQAMDIFVMPSLYEGLPCACVEAQANGLPCIISNRITEEVCFNPNVIRLPIEECSIEQWADKIQLYQKTLHVPPESCCLAIQDGGYAIDASSKVLENYYWSERK